MVLHILTDYSHPHRVRFCRQVVTTSTKPVRELNRKPQSNSRGEIRCSRGFCNAGREGGGWRRLLAAFDERESKVVHTWVEGFGLNERRGGCTVGNEKLW